MNMENKSYKLIAPLTHTHSVEIISKKHSMPNSMHRPGVKNIKVFETDDEATGLYAEMDPSERLPKKFIQLIEQTQSILTQYISANRTLMIAPITGYQLLHMNQVVYFQYSKTQKQWSVILTDRSSLLLKRSTIATDILQCSLSSLSFFRINHQHIINLGFLSGIDGKVCKLNVSTHNSEELIISRIYLKALQQALIMI